MNEQDRRRILVDEIACDVLQELRFHDLRRGHHRRAGRAEQQVVEHQSALAADRREQAPCPQALRPEGEERKGAAADSSYVASLYHKGLNKILEKVGEESVETIIAAKDAAVSGECSDVIYETADLWFHSMVMLAALGQHPQAVLDELIRTEIPALKQETEVLFSVTRQSLKGGDINAVAEAINSYATLLGKNMQFKSMEEFEGFMASNEPLRF